MVTGNVINSQQVRRGRDMPRDSIAEGDMDDELCNFGISAF